MIRRALPLVLLLIAPFVVYGGVLDQPLESDARFLTVRNSLVTGESTPAAFFTRDFFEGADTGGFVYLSGYYRPISNTVLQAVWWIAGDDPRAYNALGMLLHGIAAALLLLLVTRISGSRLAGGLAAGVWVVHPVHAFAVTEPAAVSDPLATVFYLGGLVVFARAVGIGDRAAAAPDSTDGADATGAADSTAPGTSRGAASLVAAATLLYLLALLSKESGITFPAAAVALALLAGMRDGRPLRPALLRTVPLWIVFGLYLVWRFGVLGITPGEVGYTEQLGWAATAIGVAKTVAVHLVRVVVPLGWEFPELHPSLVATANANPADPLTWLGPLLVVAGIAAALSWRRTPELAFWSSLFWIAWSPLARIDNIGGALGTSALLAQERWIYLPAIALVGGAAMWAGRGLERLDGRRTLAAVAALALLLTGLAWTASEHARVQRDPLAQLAHLYEIPEEALGRVGEANRLMYYAWRVALPQGDLPDAVDRAERAVELVPDSPIYARGLAGLRGVEGRWGEANALVSRWLDADSTFLARQAETNYRVYDDLNRVGAELWLVRGEAEARLGNPEAADRAFCRAIERGHPVPLVVAALERAPGLEPPLVCGAGEPSPEEPSGP